MKVAFLSVTSVTNFFSSSKYAISSMNFTPKRHPEIYINFHLRCPLLFSNFNHNWNVMTNVSKKSPI